MAASRVLTDAGVSEREAEILLCVGEHLTNAQIAARLYISVRTVESHVSSLLRKLGVSDRRALAELAAGLGLGDESPTTRAAPTAAALPSPLTSFVGRAAERAQLAAALGEHRLVTAVGPGGVGKTRLVLAVAADVTGGFADGAWYVDLVRVSDPTMIAQAVAAALGLGEQSRRTAEETVVARLADSEALLVLDNCEHLVDGVAVFVERVLGACPRLVVLATSRARLVVPFEWVFPVPGLSLGEDGDDDGAAHPGPAHREAAGDPTGGDAVALFVERASAVGSFSAGTEDRRRIAAICRRLDGVALAIELAAARLPALGLDGLEAALADRLRLLTGGSRVDERHRSLRATLDWSYTLLDPVDQAGLRRVSVFAAPFTPEAAAAAGGFDPIGPGETPALLARLADQSLLVPAPGPGGTRYRALDTVRQYGADRLEEAGETDETRARHVRWCLAVARELRDGSSADTAAWRSAFDAVADDLRAALAWSVEHATEKDEAFHVSLTLADLLFTRGLTGEAQRRYEQAADLTDDDGAAARALLYAAGAACGRHVGNDSLRLHRAAADAARRAGDNVGAARQLALAATLINRGPGVFAELPPPGEVDALIAEARSLARGVPEAEAAILTAEAFNGDESDPATAELTARAIAACRQVGDPLLESGALDMLTVVQLATGQLAEAAASTRRRLELLDPMPADALVATETNDAYQMATEAAIACGDLAGARRLAEGVLGLPAYSEEGHLATARLLAVGALRGDWSEVLTLSERFREGWQRAGQPPTGNLGMGACAVAMVHGLRGDDAARREWLGIVAALCTSVEQLRGRLVAYQTTFDTMVLLHRGRSAEALEQVSLDPEELREWHTGIWRHWYAALWAESAVVGGHPDAEARVDRARLLVGGNPVAGPLVTRAGALLTGDRDALIGAGTALDAAGCRYQWARTLVLAGGRERAEGEAALAAMGAAPMVA